MNTTARIASAVVSVALAILSVWHFYDDARKRDVTNDFVRRFHVAERRPDHAETIGYAPAADLAAEVAADVALQDATGTVKLSDVPPETRQLWMQAVAHVDEEINSARALLVDALRDRPGYAYHRALLGQIEYLSARRRTRLGTESPKWLQPLQSAMAFAPGDPSLPNFAAAAFIDAWPFIGAQMQARAPEVFRTAFRDAQFVNDSYLNVVDLLGHEPTFALLPDDAPPIAAAIRAESSEGDVRAASELYPRWERAEWRGREEDLQEIAERAGLNDETGLQRACAQWARRHSMFDFDNAAGRKQVLAVLDRWPQEPGAWATDPRADFVNFFLNGRADAASGPVVARVVPLFSDAPRPVAARAALLGGDVPGAEAIARSSETAGAFEWTRFYVDLAYNYLGNKKPEEAGAALGMVSAAAQDECDVALARLAVARAQSAPADVNEALFPRVYAAEYWSRNRLPVCVDPYRGDKLLSIQVDTADAPALVSFGFDDGRMRTTVLPQGHSEFQVPFEGRGGRHIFALKTITGSTVTPSTTLVQ